MKSIRKTAASVILACLLAVSLAGQQMPSALSTLTGNFLRYTTDNPFEEIFLHTDRESYAAGETVRFTAWLYSYPDLKLSGRNSYAYVELLDYYGNPVSQVVVRLERGTGESMMTLPDTLVTGSYLLRANTSVTRNYMPYGCFMKKITVANPFRSDCLDFGTSLKYVDEQPSQINFFPEGGSMVNGIPSKIGVLAVNKYGYPVRCEAEVVNSMGESIIRVMTDSSGTGSFELTPSLGETWFLVPLNSGLRFEIPAAADSGITMCVRFSDDNMTEILLREKHKGDKSVPEEGFLIIQSRGRVIYSLNLPEWNDEHVIGIPSAQLKEGVINIACFDREGNFVAERYLFLPPARGEELKLSLTGGEGRRKMTDITISPPADDRSQAERHPAEPGRPGSISVSSVSGADRIVTASEHLLTGSEFYNDCTIPGLPVILSASDRQQADNYMLGIRSAWIDWERIAEGKRVFPLYPSETDGRYLTVRQTLNHADSLAEGRIAYLVSWGAIQSFQYSVSDSDGRFRFYLEERADPEDLIIMTDSPANGRSLTIEPAFSEKRVIHSFTPDTTSHLPVQAGLERVTHRHQIRKIYGITDTAGSQPAVIRDNSVRRFYGIPDQEINLDDYVSLSSMREIFFELVKRIVVRGDRGDEGLQIWEPVMKRAPALYIDMVPVDTEAVLGLDPARVQRIDVISGDYRMGDILFPGIVSVVTRKGTFSDSPLPPGALRTPFRMSDRYCLFTTPDYSDETRSAGRIPDFRNTVYWNGDLAADSTGRLRCRFWNPDDTGDYEVTVNTVDDSGRPVSLRRKISFSGL